MVQSAAAWHYLQWPHYNASCSRMDHSVAAGGGDRSAQHLFWSWWPWPLTLTFKLVAARDQTRLPCEFGANPFSHSRDIWFANKKNKQKVTDSAKNRTLRSLLRAVIIFELEVKHVLPSIRKLHADRRKGRKMPFFVSSDLDLWPWPSDSSKRGTKHVFHVNLAQIHSAVPGIFHTQTKTTDCMTAPKT